MSNSDSVVGSVLRLNCGLVRDRGTVRTSTTSSICTSRNSSTNSGIERVECPMVKNGYMRSVQLTARDMRFSPYRGSTFWVYARAVRRRNHFLVMASFWVWHFRVNALIAHRRWRDHALMLGWRRSPLLLIGSRWVFALGNRLFRRFARHDTRSTIGGICQRYQHHSYQCIWANSEHWLLPALTDES